MDTSTLTIAGITAAGVVALQVLLSFGDVSKLQTRDDLHLRRKLQHAATGIVFVMCYPYVMGRVEGIITLFACAGVMFLLHILRGMFPAVNAAYLNLFRPILRTHEEKELPGAFYFLLGCALTIGFFPLDIAHCSILCLALGDPAGSLFGNLLGSRVYDVPPFILVHKTPVKKTVAGLVGTFLVCFLTGFIYYNSTMASMGDMTEALDWSSFPSKMTFVSGLSVGIAGMLGEAMYTGFDDNLSMPIICGCILTVISNWVAV